MKFTAIILAAGKGTRMKSALPKPLHRVGGHPMLGWSVDAARAAGATRTVAVLAPGSDEIQTWLDDTAIAIQEDQLGTGNAVAAARDAVGMEDGIAMVMFADTPLVRADSISALVAKVADGAAIAVAAFEPADPTGYGRLVQGANGAVESIVEEREPAAAQRSISLCKGGIMAARTPLLFELLDKVTNDNAKGEYYLTDIVSLASAAGHQVAHSMIDGTEILGVNDRADLAAAEAALQSRLRTTAMQAGVTMIAPETVFIAADAVIEPDVIIEPHVVIGGGCHIGEGSGEGGQSDCSASTSPASRTTSTANAAATTMKQQVPIVHSNALAPTRWRFSGTASSLPLAKSFSSSSESWTPR